MTKRCIHPAAVTLLCSMILLGASRVSAQGQLEGRGIPYGSEIGALVQAPKGWIFDSQSGVSQGLHCVMYPQGSTWSTAGEVIYVAISKLEDGQTLEDFVMADVERIRNKAPGLEVATLEAIRLNSGEETLVRGFRGDPFGNHECVAYAQLGRSVATFVLNCRTPEGYEKSILPFRDMVARAGLIRMNPDGRPGLADEESAETAGLAAYGYSHWARFRPGTFVSFKYTLKSALASEEMIKTIALKEADPGFVRLSYQESPPKSASIPVSSLLYQSDQEDYGEAEEEFETASPVESLLRYNIQGYLDDPRCRQLGGGEEEIDWRGGKLRTTWTKLRLGSGSVPTTTVTIWRCSEVPGGLFKFLREIEGAAASREEVVVEDLHAIPASAAEIERLRSLRQPVTIEIPAERYLRIRCRALKMSKGQWSFTRSFDSDASRHQSEFDADRRRIFSELGPQEIAKLAMVLDGLEALLRLEQQAREILVKAAEEAAGQEVDETAAHRIESETAALKSQFKALIERLGRALDELDGVSVTFTKKPG